MKKLGKLEINPEKLIKNEELKALKGGEDCLTSFTCVRNGVYLGCVTVASTYMSCVPCCERVFGTPIDYSIGVPCTTIYGCSEGY